MAHDMVTKWVCTAYSVANGKRMVDSMISSNGIRQACRPHTQNYGYTLALRLYAFPSSRCPSAPFPHHRRIPQHAHDKIANDGKNDSQQRQTDRKWFTQ